MRTAILCGVLAVVGCSKKSEPKSEPAKQEPAKPTTEAAKPTEDKAPEAAKPTESKPPAPAADLPKVDCNVILTAEDIEKVCGKKVEIRPGKQEGSAALFTCQRTVSPAGKRFPIAYWFLRAGKNQAEIESLAKLEKLPEAKPISGLGDEAWSSVHEEKKLKLTDYDVNVRKGMLLLKVSANVGGMSDKAPCTLDQMVELAKLGAARLP